MKHLGLILVVLALLLGAERQAQAAPITWSAATNITGSSDVSTAGTLVGAFNVGPSPSNVTVNGVAFTGLAMSGSTVTSGNFTFTLSSGWGTNNITSGNAPFAALPASYQQFLANLAGDGGTPFTVTINGLTVGAQYQFEWWTNDPNGFQALTTATAGNSVTLNSNTSGLDGGIGQFAIGTFTANAASELITFTAAAGSEFGESFFSGLELRQISAVPEPTSLALFGLATLTAGYFGLRRRKPAVA